MPATISNFLSTIVNRLKIAMLKSEIRKASKASYMSLYERIELRDSINLLHNLEQQLQSH